MKYRLAPSCQQHCMDCNLQHIPSNSSRFGKPECFKTVMGNIQSKTHYIFKENLEKVSACKEQDKNKCCMFVTVSPCSGSALKTHIVL